VMLVQIIHFSAAGAASAAMSAAGAAARAITARACCLDRLQDAEATPAAAKQGAHSAGPTREREGVRVGAFKRLIANVCMCFAAAGFCSAGARKCAMLAVQYRPAHDRSQNKREQLRYCTNKHNAARCRRDKHVKVT
jgi:hypothetical protein